MKQSEVTELVEILAAAFPRPQMTEATCNVYERMLCDLDRELAHRAVARLITSSKWLPTVAEIRGAATELTAGPRRLGGEAWGDVGQAVRLVGRYREPEFEDPIVAECVRLLGWQTLCDGTNESADRARFIELYDGLATRERRELVVGPWLALPRPNRGSGGGLLPASSWTPLRGAEEPQTVDAIEARKRDGLDRLAAFEQKRGTG